MPRLRPILYKGSLVILLILFIGLLCITPLDIILQSEQSGQFWNVIIIVAAYVLTVVIALVLYILRLLNTRRTLSDIPRIFIPREDDTFADSAKLISSELQRCNEIVESTRSPNPVSHPGLLPPELREGGLDIPYYEIVRTSCLLVESKAVALHSSFSRPPGMSFREYLDMLYSYGIIKVPSHITEFLNHYEKARFSGHLLTQNEFTDYMEYFFLLLHSVGPPISMDLLKTSQSYTQTPVAHTPDIFGHSSLSRSNTRTDPPGGSIFGHSNLRSSPINPHHSLNPWNSTGDRSIRSVYSRLGSYSTYSPITPVATRMSPRRSFSPDSNSEHYSWNSDHDGSVIIHHYS